MSSAFQSDKAGCQELWYLIWTRPFAMKWLDEANNSDVLESILLNVVLHRDMTAIYVPPSSSTGLVLGQAKRLAPVYSVQCAMLPLYIDDGRVC